MTSSPNSLVPYMYPMFIKAKNPHLGFTEEEKQAIKNGNHVQLLPPFHKDRRSNAVAWVVSNFNAKNNRADFAYAISYYMNVSNPIS